MKESVDAEYQQITSKQIEKVNINARWYDFYPYFPKFDCNNANPRNILENIN